MNNIIYNITKSACQLLDKQAIIANNLANISTNSFKEKFLYFIKNPKNIQDSVKPYYNFSSGTPNYTNRDLDVYVKDDGWLSVIDQNGKEAYTKNGHLNINLQGELVSQNYQIIGKNKTIKIPPGLKIKILADGTIIVVKQKLHGFSQDTIDKIKLIAIPSNFLIQKDNGLFYIKNNKHDKNNLNINHNAKLESGFLEESNVSTTKNMINMISNAREFEMQMKTLSIFDKNSEYANQLLDVNN